MTIFMLLKTDQKIILLILINANTLKNMCSSLIIHIFPLVFRNFIWKIKWKSERKKEKENNCKWPKGLSTVNISWDRVYMFVGRYILM